MMAFVFPHGEQSKCIKTLSDIFDFLCEQNITRKDFIIALGGGVVGDITGFAAACFLRGIDFIQISHDASCTGRFVSGWKNCC